MRLYISVLKPLSDFLVSMIAILLVSPVLILFSLMLFTVNSGSPFFIQQRSGKHGYIFNVIKFKTMNDRRDSKGNLLSDAQRLTTLGRFMRKQTVLYLYNISFPLDVKILLLTVRKVFMNKGISSSTSETMEIFTGNKN